MIKTKSMNKKLYHKTSTYLSHSVMQSTMEKTSPSNRRREELHYDLRDELLKACISTERTNSRRLSASNLTSFREEARSFRYTTTFSSTASSPRYPTRGITFMHPFITSITTFHCSIKHFSPAPLPFLFSFDDHFPKFMLIRNSFILSN